MTIGFTPTRATDITEAVAQLLLPRLADAIRNRLSGHCMRVHDLDVPLTLRIAAELRRIVPSAAIHVLSSSAQSDELYVTSTKLVELRNPLPDGALRPPLCVFVPPGTKASAEDSFGVATFEDFSVGAIYQDVSEKLLATTPAELQNRLRDILQYLAESPWPWAGPLNQVRYLLLAAQSEFKPDAVGAALCELGLVPDFRLLESPAAVFARIKKNLDCVTLITASDRTIRSAVLDLDLSERVQALRLADHLMRFGTEEPLAWTRAIVSDRSNWDLSFDKWKFSSRTPLDKINIQSVVTDLPTVTAEETDEKLADLVGQQVLVPKERKRINVVIDVLPHPSQVSGLDHLSVQIVSRSSGPVGVTKNVKLWTAKKNSCTVRLTKLDNVDFDEGWHFIRVLAWTADSDPILIESSSAGAKPTNESEPFYVLPQGSIEEEPQQRALPRAFSAEHARVEKQFTAVSQKRDPSSVKLESVAWAQTSSGKRSSPQDILEAKFGPEGTVQVTVPRWLKIIEQRILSAPEQAVSWRMQVNLGTPNHPTADPLDLPNSNAARAFTDARLAYFTEIRNGARELVTQGADLHQLKSAAVTYGSTYEELIKDLIFRVQTSTGNDQQKAVISLRGVLAIDTVRLVSVDYRGRVREAALISPTHPLRALWHACWSELSDQWIDAARNAPEDSLAGSRSALIRVLTPLNFPAVLSLADGRQFACVDNIHPFWTLYAPATEEDPRGLLGEICAALDLDEPSIGGSTLTAEVLAARIERYLIQHPYVKTLSINIFNPGRAELLADALLCIHERKAFSNLRYDIRLFVPDPESSGIGDALNQLLTPESISAIDVFSIASRSHLFPKLAIAVRATADFRSTPKLYRANLTLMFDVFPAEEIGTARPLAAETVASLGGLVQDFISEFHDDESGTSWTRQPRFARLAGTANEQESGQLLCSLPKAIAIAAATSSQGGNGTESYPAITLELDAEQRALIHNVHEVSDWVFTVDRNMGIEFFDHGGRKDRPDYLIDFVPSSAPGQGHQLIVSSRSLSELEAMLRPVLKQYGLDGSGDRATMILGQLRALSGRIALKLVSSSTAKAEVLGLALARLFLDSQRALRNQVVVPLDSHIDLFLSAKTQIEQAEDDIAVRRTDLALFDLDFASRTINCNLVEVKCYAQRLGFSGFAQLKEAITAQIDQSERVLQYHFDPSRTSPDRPDRALKTRELTTMLRFYLHRAVRYGLFDENALGEANAMLDSLQAGYQVRFTRSGLVFDFEKPGTEVPENEAGIEFHRIGFDLIQQLVSHADPKFGSVTASTSDEGSSGGRVNTSEAGTRRLTSAAFFPRERERRSTESETDTPAHRPSSDSDVQTERQEVSKQRSEAAPFATAAQQSSPALGEPAPHANVHPDSHSDIREVSYDVLLGALDDSPQYGLLAEVGGRRLAIDLNQTHTMSLFGVQGGGKSYTLATIMEMACMPIPGIAVLPRPLATILFHYSATLDYKPEFTSMISPNSNAAQIKTLKERFGATPQGLSDIVVLVPASKMEERAREYSGIQVLPIAFAARELKASHWKFLMGAVGSQTLYLRQVNLMMKRLRQDLTLPSLVAAVEQSGLSDHLKELALVRLKFASEYINDSVCMTDIARPGRLVIVDLRDEFIEKDEALGLFVVLLQLFAEATYGGHGFNKLVVFDEAHKYMDSPDLISGLVEVVREMRHKGTSVLVASQDPPSVPTALIELSSQIFLHKFNSPAWLKHIQKANSALNGLTPERLRALGAGEAYVWSSKATDPSFSHGAVKVRCRPRVTHHGGATKTAL